MLNIGSGKSYEIRKIINILKKINKRNFVIQNKGVYKSDDILSTQLDIKRAKKILKWEPLCNLEKGLKNTIYNRN